MFRTILLFSLSCLLSIEGKTQDTLNHKRVRILPVPAFGYSPETKTYVGAVAMFTLDLYEDTTTRSSNAKLEFNYTWLKQVIIESEWNYLFEQEKWFSQGLLHYSYFPDYYFGIGSNSKESDRSGFSSTRIKTDISLLKQLKGNWFFGGGFRYFDYLNVSSNEPDMVSPELKDGRTFGLNVISIRDNRNNILTPTSGNYLKILSSHNYSSNYFSTVLLDARKYITIGKKSNQTFSGRIYSQHVFGEAPFYDLAILGGDKIARGYYYGRFRDSNVSSLQMEYRSTLFWRLGIAVFGGYSAVYGQPGNTISTSLKPNGGMGLRFMVDKKEKTNLRFDFAIGSDKQTGFYVSFGESF
jgi:hypothetical protein